MKKNSAIIMAFFLSVIIFLASVLPAAASTGTINGSVVRVRSGPGTEYQETGNLMEGTEVKILQTSGDWYQIQYGSLTGWTAASLIDMQEKTVRVSGELVNLRSGPGTSYEKTGQAVKGDLLTVVGSSGDWYQVRDGAGHLSYIAAFLVEGGASAAAGIQVSGVGKIQVKDGPVNIRSGPGTSYDKAGMVEDGAIFTVVEESGDWYKILLQDGSNAYVAAWLVDKVETLAPAPALTSPEDAALQAPLVFLNKQKLSFDVPPVIESGRTLVPLRAIFEAMGASVEWDNGTRTVTAQKGTTIVVLPIGSTSPTVNGTEWKLDVPARIVQDRTLAPLRFVGEAFGGQVAWDEATRTINISSNSTPVNPEEEGATLAAVTVKNDEVNLRSGPSTDYALVAKARSGERLDVMGEQDGWYQVSRGGSSAWIAGWLVESIFEDNSSSSGSTEEIGENPTSEGNSAVYDLDTLNSKGNEDSPVAEGLLSISTRRSPEGYRLVMKTADGIEPLITEKENGKKIIFTFEGVCLESGRDEAYFYLGSGRNEKVYIDAVSLDNTTWVSVNLPLAYAYQTSSEEEGRKQVFLIPPQLKEIREVTLNNGNHIIAIRSIGEMDYSEILEDDLLSLKIPDAFKGICEDEYSFSGRGAQKLLVNQLSGEEGLEVLLELRKIETYQISKNMNGDIINVILLPAEVIASKKEIVTPQEITVVIDPGHGGKDGGAPGYSRTIPEKVITLKVAAKVEEILKKEDLHIIMTRKDDTYLDQYERCDIANEADADLFVSIHCDSFTTSTPNGTSSFYYAPADSPLSAQELQRSLLADMLQKNLMKNLNRNNRGVKQANYAVLRETQMPSALVELAFISNPEEEQLLFQDSFQQKAADAIAQAIIDYIKLMIH